MTKLRYVRVLCYRGNDLAGCFMVRTNRGNRDVRREVRRHFKAPTVFLFRGWADHTRNLFDVLAPVRIQELCQVDGKWSWVDRCIVSTPGKL